MPPATNLEDRLQTGDVIAQRYEIVRRLGGGAFGDVYEGNDRSIGRKVAVKVLNLDPGTDPERRQKLVERFNREARSAGSIHHPAVITIHDVGVLGDTLQPFMVMELLEGHDLHQELKKNGPLAPHRLIPLFCQTLDALGQAHQLGIVHKDLKPENLFLIHPGTDREAIKIVDFGVAHVRNDDAGRLTAAGEFFSTANYISPEYMTEQLVLPQMDVYQMGLILVELLLGVPIVSDKSPTRCLMIHAMGQLEFPASLASSPLAPIVARAVAFNHNDRYPDARAFLQDLQRIDPDTLSTFSTAEPRIPLADLLKAPAAPAQTPQAAQPARPAPVERLDTPTVQAAPSGDAWAFREDAAQPPPTPTSAPTPARSSTLPIILLGVAIVAIGFLLTLAILLLTSEAPAATLPHPDHASPPPRSRPQEAALYEEPELIDPKLPTARHVARLRRQPKPRRRRAFKDE